MTNRNLAAFLLTVLLLGSVSIKPALAHRFNVALVIEFATGKAEQGRQYRQGFMLATTERDAHAGEESDGHLGGLDVYVSEINAGGDLSAELARIAAPGDIDIVATFGSPGTWSLANKLLAGADIALLPPGQSPFARPELPGVANFMAAFENRYGGKPSAFAAQGYHAARRIDVAVRAQGKADDKAALRRSFSETGNRFDW
ncbi:MAG: ABC transporter substrate-binding protein [Hyphomicrobiales bacterium]